MADNTTLNAGTGGDVIASDDITGVKYQRVKLTLGADGVNDGDVASGNPIPVTGTITAVTAITNALPAGANNIGDVDVLTLPSIPAGNNNIGDVDIASIAAGDNNIGNVDIVTMPNVTNGGTFAVQDSEKVVDNTGFTDGTTKVLPSGYIFDEVAGTALTENDAAAARIDSKRAQINVIEDATTRGQRLAISTRGGAEIEGVLAHDAPNTGVFPILNGLEAIAHSTNPTAVAAGDITKWYASRAGIPFVIGGHPNIQSAEYFTSGAQTDDPVIAVVSAGTKIVITSITVTCSSANATTPSVRIGFGATTLTAQGVSGADGVAKIIVSHPGIPAGSGIVKGNGSGIVGIGGDGEDLRITCTTPTTSLIVQVDYYTIES